MKIGIIDVDSKIANLPLMKIKGFYGDKCDWYSFIEDYDKVYLSKIFNFTKDYDYIIKSKEIVRGGSGYDIKSKLPIEIEDSQPDYSIYPNCDYTLQRLTIGCIRNCSFCIVREKEGCLRDVEPMNNNPKANYIYLLDNNLFASKNWKQHINYLMSQKLPIKFEGIDIRLLTEEMMAELNKVLLYKQLHFAWDDPNCDITEKLKLITKIIKPYKLMCYVLIGYNSNEEEDIYRVETLRKYGINPFVMPYDKNDKYQKRLARYVNHKAIFKKIKWRDYV